MVWDVILYMQILNNKNMVATDFYWLNGYSDMTNLLVFAGDGSRLKINSSVLVGLFCCTKSVLVMGIFILFVGPY